MTATPWFKFFPSDWLAGTRGLTATETGVYITLVSLMYDHGKPIALDPPRLARMCGATPRQFDNALARLVRERKILALEPGLWNERVGVEMQKREEKICFSRNAVAARERKKTQENQSENLSGDNRPIIGRSSIPEARSQNIESNSASVPSSDLFDTVEAALRQVEGIGNHPVAVDPVIGPIVALVQSGYSLKAEIIPSIKRQLAKRGNRRVSRWSFFVPGIIDDRAGATPAAPSIALAEWTERLTFARKNRQWPARWGALPNQPGTLVPQQLVQPGDGDGWTEWRAAS